MKNTVTTKEPRRIVEDLLKGNDERLTQLINNSFDMMVLLDGSGIQRYVSEPCEKILGYKPEEVIDIPVDKVINELIHPEDQEKAAKGLKELIEKKIKGGVQYRHRHKNGGWVYLEASGTNQLDNPAIQYLVLSVRDITDRKLAEQALQESEKRLKELNATKDKFFSIIGHDLKNPLSIIHGLSGLLLEQIQKQENYKELEKNASVIQKSSQRVADLVSNLFIWSQSQTGKIKFNPEYFELTALIDEVTELLNGWALQKSINISKKLPKHIPVTADSDMINTVLRNLISNSIKFTENGGNISISAKSKDRQVVVSVKDSGIGIKKEDIDKLFLIEAPSSHGAHEESGTGLGLLLCKEFIDKHGGKILAESTEGKGSTFSFTLPQI